MIPETTACIHSYGKKIAGKDCQSKALISRINAVNQVLCGIESSLRNQVTKLDLYCDFEYSEPPSIQPPAASDPGCFPSCSTVPEFLYMVTVNNLDADVYELVELVETEVCDLLRKIEAFAATNESHIDPLEPEPPPAPGPQCGWIVTSIMSRPDNGMDDSAVGKVVIMNTGETELNTQTMTLQGVDSWFDARIVATGIGTYFLVEFHPKISEGIGLTILPGDGVEFELQVEKDMDTGSDGYSIDGLMASITTDCGTNSFVWDDSAWIE